MNYYIKALKKYAEFNGRANRSEFWFFVLFNVIINVVLSFIGVDILTRIYGLAVLIPNIAVGIRRMHDVGKSGWFILIPIYNIVLAATEGDKGDNEFGPESIDEVAQ